EPEENDGDDEKSEGNSIDYPTSEGDNDADDDGDDLSKDDAGSLVMTIGLDLPKQILGAQTEARKPKNLK
nr:hypothetical protein [Tanacetum cinerariifolium]